MSARDRALAGTGDYAFSEPFDAPWAGDDRIKIRSLGSDARLALMGSVDPVSQTMDLSVLRDQITELVCDADSGDPLFELADLDTVLKKYPALCSKAILTSVSISDLGDAALEEAKGNSEANPS